MSEGPTRLPLADGSRFAIEVCSPQWEFGGRQLRVAVTTPVGEPIQYGGPGALVWITHDAITPRPSQEMDFLVVKSGGGTVGDGDEVRIATRDGWYLRVETPQGGDSPIVLADTKSSSAATVFGIELSQVAPKLGWRPKHVKCVTCGQVTGTVKSGGTGHFVDSAGVVALGTNFSATTGADGVFKLAKEKPPPATDCVPEGDVVLETTADRHKAALRRQPS